ncbi:MAG: protoporphyrinogen oxidase [Lentisphaeria bacterium]|nr:protoporphyrinogen oxidase [Lentisphaeria bacterium]
MLDLAIIGGGITGLTAGWTVLKEHKGINFKVLEASDRVGGKVKTLREDGFILETGPDSMVVQKPAAIDLCQDLGLSDDFIPSLNGPTEIFFEGDFFPMPKGIKLVIPTDYGAFSKTTLLSPEAIERVKEEVNIPARDWSTDETLYDFLSRRFGEEYTERFAAPMLSGIFVADPRKLSVKAAFPGFVMMEKKFGSLTKAMGTFNKATKVLPEKVLSQSSIKAGVKSLLKGNHPALKKGPFVTLRPGMEKLTETLAEHLKSNILFNSAVMDIQKKGDLYILTLSDGQIIETKKILITLPGPLTQQLFTSSFSNAANAVSKIRVTSTATHSMIFSKDDIKDNPFINNQGVILADKTAFEVLSCTITSNKYEGRASDEYWLIRVYYGGDLGIDTRKLSDEKFYQLTLDNLQKLLKVDALPIKHVLQRWENTIPLYDLEHVKLIETIEEVLAEESIAVAGCFFRGVGLSDCINDAKTQINKLLA